MIRRADKKKLHVEMILLDVNANRGIDPEGKVGGQVEKQLLFVKKSIRLFENFVINGYFKMAFVNTELNNHSEI